MSVSTIERISDFSSFPLLERTNENHLNLEDAIRRVKKSNIEGLVGVQIYQRQRVNQKIGFEYLSGFGVNTQTNNVDKDLFKTLENKINDQVYFDNYTIKKQNKVIHTYRFVKPIIYTYQGKEVLLGVTLLYYDKEVISSIIETLFNFILTIAIIIALFAILFVYFLGMRLTRPILKITEAATSISKGDLNIHLDIKTNDEIEDLANHFNTMVDDLQERKDMQKFVSRPTMDMIQNNVSKDIVLGGEYRTLVVFFSDIRNFTVLTEENEPSEVINIVNFYLNLQCEIIKENKGYIDKFIGDAIMVSFDGENAIQRAIESALKIQSKIIQENILRVQENKIICEVGIGINMGEMIVGNIGSFEHMDFTAIGLHVNIASRLCSKAQGGEVIVSKKSCINQKMNFHISKEEAYSVKGISYPIETYTLVPKRN